MAWNQSRYDAGYNDAWYTYDLARNNEHVLSPLQVIRDEYDSITDTGEYEVGYRNAVVEIMTSVNMQIAAARFAVMTEANTSIKQFIQRCEDMEHARWVRDPEVDRVVAFQDTDDDTVYIVVYLPHGSNAQRLAAQRQGDWTYRSVADWEVTYELEKELLS